MQVDRRLVRALLFFVSAFFASSLRADSLWTVPGIVNTSGLNGTHFVSDLAMTNPGTVAASVTLSLISTSAVPAKSVVLGPGQTIVDRDVVGGFFASPGLVGALSISSDQPLLLRARTYNNAGVGTFGVALPVFSDESFLAAGDSADSLWVSQSADASTGYRTNIAVMFPDDAGGDAIVTVFDANGTPAGRQTYSRSTAGFLQISAGSFAGAVAAGRAHIEVLRGRAGGYAVVNDNVTGDSSLFTFEDLPAGIQDVLISGVARAGGRNGTFFRTDGRFYNPTDTDASVTVAFHAAGEANATPPTATFTLAAGKVRDVVDVLDVLLGLPVGSSGALRFKSTWPVAILCRTSNVDPLGVKPGTFGSQQKPVPLLSFLSSADAGAVVAGIRQNAAFRTNVGFAAGADGAVCSLTLKTAVGATASTSSVSLGAFGWTQPSVQDLFPGVTIPDDATLQVKVTSGSVDVYDSSIDNTSGDSVLTPIAPLPAAIPASATIGPPGGSIRSSDGRITLKIPAGALTGALAFSFQDATNDAPLGVGPGYQILPTSVAFAKPALLMLAYGRADTTAAPAAALSLVVSAGSDWYVAGGGAADVARHTVTVPLTSTSPAISAASSPPRASLDPGAPAWAVAHSWQFLPGGTQSLLVGAQRTFVVRRAGPASTATGDPFTPDPPPADLDVEWLVDDVVGGTATSGTIVRDAVRKSGIFSAPACPPPDGFVIVRAKLAGLFTLPYVIPGYAHVYIVPRKWTLTFIGSAEARCSGPQAQQIADKVTWTVEADVILDDSLKFSENEFPPRYLTMSEGPPTLCVTPGCGPVTSIVVQGSVEYYSLASQGTWYPEDGKLVFNLNIGTRGPDEYDVFACGSADPAPFDRPVCQINFNGQVSILAENFIGEQTVSSGLIDKYEGDRVDASIVVKLKPVCP